MNACERRAGGVSSPMPGYSCCRAKFATRRWACKRDGRVVSNYAHSRCSANGCPRTRLKSRTSMAISIRVLASPVYKHCCQYKQENKQTTFHHRHDSLLLVSMSSNVLTSSSADTQSFACAIACAISGSRDTAWEWISHSLITALWFLDSSSELTALSTSEESKSVMWKSSSSSTSSFWSCRGHSNHVRGGNN
jgi:hypothetical protein